MHHTEGVTILQQQMYAAAGGSHDSEAQFGRGLGASEALLLKRGRWPQWRHRALAGSQGHAAGQDREGREGARWQHRRQNKHLLDRVLLGVGANTDANPVPSSSPAAYMHHWVPGCSVGSSTLRAQKCGGSRERRNRL